MGVAVNLQDPQRIEGLNDSNCLVLEPELAPDPELELELLFELPEVAFFLLDPATSTPTTPNTAGLIGLVGMAANPIGSTLAAGEAEALVALRAPELAGVEELDDVVELEGEGGLGGPDELEAEDVALTF